MEKMIMIIFFIFLIILTLWYSFGAISKKSHAKKMKKIFDASPYRDNNKKHNKPDEFRARNEKKERVVEHARFNPNLKVEREEELEKEESQVVKYNEKGQSVGVKDDTTIVGIAEPKGFWSRLIMSQKIGFMMSFAKQKDNKHGFWVNLINAQSKSQSREKGRGR